MLRIRVIKIQQSADFRPTYNLHYAIFCHRGNIPEASGRRPNLYAPVVYPTWHSEEIDTPNFPTLFSFLVRIQ